jgi:hypothetical protein
VGTAVLLVQATVLPFISSSLLIWDSSPVGKDRYPVTWKPSFLHPSHASQLSILAPTYPRPFGSCRPSCAPPLSLLATADQDDMMALCACAPPARYPLVVKLGTITPHGADVYS